VRAAASRSPTLSPFTERPQQVASGPSSGFRDIRRERRDASKKGCAPEVKKAATVPLNKRIALLA